MSQYKIGIRHGKSNTYKPPIGTFRAATGIFTSRELKAQQAYNRGWPKGRKLR